LPGQLASFHCARRREGASPPPPSSCQKRDASWPGNVRELRNTVARAVVLGGDDAFADGAPDEGGATDALPTDLDALAEDAVHRGEPIAVARQRVVDAFEERYLERVLAAHDGNMSRAATAAGVARRHLQRLRARQRP
jgi:DNA-binding NtrC family response regulator